MPGVCRTLSTAQPSPLPPATLAEMPLHVLLVPMGTPGDVQPFIDIGIALRSRGIQLNRTDVGDKYVLEELLRTGAVLGGEQSGHIIFPKLSLAGDGMMTTLCLLRAIEDEKRSLSDLTRGFQRYPQVLINVRVRERKPFTAVPAIQESADEIRRDLGERGRLLLRYSGTEPLARVMIEGEDESDVNAKTNALADVIRRDLGA